MSVFQESQGKGFVHLDGDNNAKFLTQETVTFLKSPENFQLVSGHAYVGARGVKRALDLGCDIVICKSCRAYVAYLTLRLAGGRVADASPVVGAAWWWHSWSDRDYDQLAGSLVAGHLIECSGYGSGGNFCEFFQFPLDQLVDIGFPIAEIAADGTCLITKHEGTRGFVTGDVVKSQLLYEIQGDIYLHSDSKADLSNLRIEEEGKDRVRVSGAKGLPPPPTTKAAIFYKGGWQCEYTLNATGYATLEKFKLHEKQIRYRLSEEKELDNFDTLEFQVCGLPETNPRSQLRSSTAIRVIGQAKNRSTLLALTRAFLETLLQHYSGMHGSMDWRLLEPKPYLAYCPCLIPQARLEEQVHVLSRDDDTVSVEKTFSPPAYEDMSPRHDYEPQQPVPLHKFGPSSLARLGDVVLARSGDKGANLNAGFFVREPDEWDWLRSFLDKTQMIRLMDEEWKDIYRLERCELPGIQAVHFVIYGILLRGVSSSARLDALGKGFADYIRDRWVPIPDVFLKRYADTRPQSHRTLRLTNGV